MWPSIAVAPRKTSDRVRDWLAAHEAVTEPVFTELVRAFPDLKIRALRKAVRECGLPLDPLVEGVRQESLQELKRTLTGLQAEYQRCGTDRTRMQTIRAMVIESKAHARFAARHQPEKQEMVEWMLVWLENPSLFDTWARLRMRSLRDCRASQMSNPDTEETDQD